MTQAGSVPSQGETGSPDGEPSPRPIVSLPRLFYERKLCQNHHEDANHEPGLDKKLNENDDV